MSDITGESPDDLGGQQGDELRCGIVARNRARGCR